MEFCDLLAAKCGKIASVLNKTGSSPSDLTRFLEEIPASPESFELVARFCQGYDLNMSPENVVPLTCLAHSLDMSESRCRNNLLRRALLFFERRVLPGWNETLRAYRAAAAEALARQAARIGLLGACIDSLVSKALSDPTLLGDCVDDERESPKSARRRLFALGWRSDEELTTLPLRLYEPLLREMARRGVPSRHVAASLCDYARQWTFGVFSEEEEEDETASFQRRNSRREIAEAVERLLPVEITGTFLFEMLACASLLEASSECRDSLEARIGRGLDGATVADLLVLSRGRSKEDRYDIDCLRRMLKHFYGNYANAGMSGLIRVAELVEEYLSEVASNVDLGRETFAELAEISAGVSRATWRSSDGVYKGVDVYLDSHGHLTEAEREEVCRALDPQTMSPEARDHAARNRRLPVRVVVQVLFAAQLRIRDSIVAAEEEEEEAGLLTDGEDRSAVEAEMRAMSEKLGEIERECVAMKREIGGGERRVVKKEKKASLWKEMKRKFGCVGASVSDCNCQQVSKKNKRS